MKRWTGVALWFGVCISILASSVAVAARGVGAKPTVAVLRFKNKADNPWWQRSGAQAVQDVFVTELVKSGRFRVVEREQLQALMREKNLTLSGDVDPATAVRVGKLLGVNYLLTGAVTEYGVTDRTARGAARRTEPRAGARARRGPFAAAMKASLIDTSTGEIVWADEARAEESSARVSVGGFGGGVDDDRMFDKVMKPTIQKLSRSLGAARL
jgi:curli biogenesis system outer membrane secretion channel CsgG